MPELLDMKRGIVELYGFDISSISRPHDFLDIAILENLAKADSTERTVLEAHGGLLDRLRDIIG